MPPHAHQAHYAVQEVERPSVWRGKQVQASKTPEAVTQKQVGLNHSGRYMTICQVWAVMYPDGPYVLHGLETH